MSAVSSTPISFPKFKKFIRSLDLSQDELIRRYNVMNHMVIEEIKNANNKKVVYNSWKIVYNSYIRYF